MNVTLNTQVLVLGSGPGGYSAAFRAADMGLDVTLVEKHADLGGVCLNVGCIPSKALLHVANSITEAENAAHTGVTFQSPTLDLDAIRRFKEESVGKLVRGLHGMAASRHVRVLHGEGTFQGSHTIRVTGDDDTLVQFEHCIIAVGSHTVQLPFIPQDDPRVWDSTQALQLKEIPEKLLVIGGGIIGLEMATVYQALGSDITLVEFAEQLIPAADKDLVGIYQRYNRDRFDIRLNTRVTSVTPREEGLHVSFEGHDSEPQTFDAVLVATGRRPNGHRIGAETAGIHVDEHGFIQVDAQLRTNLPHILAIGDVNGDPMLAHKASHEGHVAAEVVAGHKAGFAPLTIPSIAYTNPEIAWTGMTEHRAKAEGIPYKTAVIPWSAIGRAIGADRAEGRTKLIYHREKGTLLGGGIVGINAGELLGELSLAIEFGADVEDIALTIHAHPTLHESVGLAAELANGTITDLPNPSARSKPEPAAAEQGLRPIC